MTIFRHFIKARKLRYDENLFAFSLQDFLDDHLCFSPGTEGAEPGLSPAGDHRGHRAGLHPLRHHQADDHHLLYQAEEGEQEAGGEEAG